MVVLLVLKNVDPSKNCHECNRKIAAVPEMFPGTLRKFVVTELFTPFGWEELKRKSI